MRYFLILFLALMPFRADAFQVIGSGSVAAAAPTCSDGVQNGDETGVDCGGSCAACGGGSSLAVLQKDYHYKTTTVTHTSFTAGSLIAVWISGGSNVESTTLSGGGVTTWSYTTPRNSGPHVWGKWGYGITTGGTAALTIGSAPTDPGWSMYEISGTATSDILDQQNFTAAVANSSVITTGSITTTQADEIILVVLADETNNPNPTWDAGWIEETRDTSHWHYTAVKIVSSIGTYDGSGSGTITAYATLGYTVSFKAAP